MEEIDPKQLVCHRVLLDGMKLKEVLVCESSPSGDYIKLAAPGGDPYWIKTEDIVIAEDLGPARIISVGKMHETPD